MTYMHDIFISYRRSPEAGLWVRKFFLPLLKERLDQNCPARPNIFCDEQIEAGSNWTNSLRSALLHSKLLLAVWSADYFRSEWCVAEWKSFKEREQRLKLFGPNNPNGLIYPIRYADGDYYHPDAKLTQITKDFTRLNYASEAFRQSVKWLEFDGLVSELAIELATRISSAPPWEDSFPVVQPAALPAANQLNPRL